MKCLFPQGFSEFLAVLSSKLGDDHEFCYGSPEMLHKTDSLAACDVVIVCVPHPKSPVFAAKLAELESAVLHSGSIPVVVFVPTPDSDLVREVIARGAYDYFSETQSLDELRIVLRRASTCGWLARQVHRYQQPEDVSRNFEAYLGTDPNLVSVVRFAQKVARTEANILITGETGTGKELMARSIHEASARAGQPFIAVACSSLPESLIESELFGHEKGAFTGATMVRKGRFEAAEHGTIFLDEIGELSAALQVKLLRVLQERTFERLGSNQERTMGARVICATNRDLRTMARSGMFRMDLYYRVNTVEIRLPALRERQNDIAPLAMAFLEKFARRQQRPCCRLSNSVVCALRRYSWPGNVRELEHVMERAVLLSDLPEIQLENLPPEVLTDIDGPSSLPTISTSGSFEGEVRLFKRELIARALRESGDNKVRAARVLQISRSSLHRLIEELEIEPQMTWVERAS